MKKYVIAAGLLLCAGLAVFLALRSPAAFAGSRVKDPDSYTLDVRQMSGTDVHTLELRAGDVLHVRFRTRQGSLHMEIKSPDRAVLYAGNGRDVNDFTVSIPQSGVYSVVVQARHARGSIEIHKGENRS